MTRRFKKKFKTDDSFQFLILFNTWNSKKKTKKVLHKYDKIIRNCGFRLLTIIGIDPDEK